MIIPNENIETCWSPAVRYLEEDLTILIDRIDRLTSFESDHLIWVSLFELIVVQLRAITCEREVKNYTVQGILSRLGEMELAAKFNGFMGQDVGRDRFGNCYSYRKAIKTLADKFICHHDNCDETEIPKALQREAYWDLVNLLGGGVLRKVVSMIKETIAIAIDRSAENLKQELICRLFGSQDEYMRIQNIKWPCADERV